MEKQQERAQEQAHIALLTALIPALDNLGYAFRQTPAEVAPHPWARGLQLAASELAQTLARQGMRRISQTQEGLPFDPYRHEAIAVPERADMPEGTVIEVVRPGYSVGTRLLRPASVVVSISPEE